VPLLKFSELKLVIDFDNSDEINLLPQILEEGEEEEGNKMNNNLLNSNRKMEEIRVDNSQNNLNNISQQSNSNIFEYKQLMETNTRLKDEIKMIKDNYQKKMEDLNKEHNLNLRELQDKLGAIHNKISESEVIIGVKDKEIKKLMDKIEQSNRKTTFYQNEIEKLGKSIDTINETFINQIKLKDEKLKEKIIENENLLKNNFKNFECVMCRDSISNSLEYQTWNPYIKDLNEKLLEKNNKLNKLENRFQELVIQTQFIKKTYFNHLNSVISNKNNEIFNLRQMYEGRLMSVEENLTNEKIKYEALTRENQKHFNDDIKKQYDDESKNKQTLIKNMEKKYNDIQKEYNELNQFVKKTEKQKNQIENEKGNLNNEIASLKGKIEVYQKQLDEFKNKEINLNLEIKSKENSIESIKREMKTFEKEIELLNKKNKKN